MVRNTFVWLILALAVAALLFTFNPFSNGPAEVPISEVLNVIAKDVREGREPPPKITIIGNSIEAETSQGTLHTSKEEGSDFLRMLHERGIRDDQVTVQVQRPNDLLHWIEILSPWLITLIMLGGLLFLIRQAQSGNSQAMMFGKSRARMFSGDKPTVTFADVAGVEEAKHELEEIVEFLKEPTKFTALGARIPRGVLVMGPPGTGKTLLARAVAGEAGVPFFSISGSEFVEMFVGVGASVTGDTPVLMRTPKGTRLLPIAEFVDDYYEGDAAGFAVPVSDVQTLGFEEKDSKFKGSPKRFFGRSAWKRVAAVYRHRVSEIYEIHYLGGVIRTTADHSLFIRTRDGLRPVAARDLRPGDVLVNLPVKVRGEYSPDYGTPHSIRAHTFADQTTPVELPVWNDDPEAVSAYAFALEQQDTMSQAAIGQAIGVSQATVGNWQRGRSSPRPLTRNLVKQPLPESVPVTPALLKLLGYYTAEGRATPHLEFVFGGHEQTLHEDCIALMRQVFAAEPTLSPTTENTLRIAYPRPLGRFFARYCGEGSHHKHVPEMLWDLPWEYFVAYLEGYAQGDGYVTQEGKLSIASASKQLITELTWLCAMHGIKAGVRHLSQPGGRVIKSKPLPPSEAWNLIIGKTSNPFGEAAIPDQGKKPVVQEVVVKPYDGYVYDLCGCENEAFFGGEKPILLHNSRVRDLFDQAKRNAPCIVFVDEIDAVGRQRGAGLGGSHDEREQTLNQILVEMDGFDTNTNVIVVAATNRPDILDPALLRPGRFDRRVVLDRPDMNGRRAIFEVHVRGKPLADDVDLLRLAQQTPGLSGADIANVVNEAAILAARQNKKSINMEDFLEAVEKVIAGPERRSRLISDEEKRIIAYHEGGHALVAHMLPLADPVRKISIVSRGMALGYTMSLPEEDRYLTSRNKFRDDLAALLGGHAAEKLVFGDVTTGPSSDLERATKLARQMVTQFGMSERLGPMTFGQKEELIFLGREIAEQRDYSEKVAQEIDHEVQQLVREAYDRATEILVTHRDKLDLIAQQLIERETLEEPDFLALFGESA